MIYGLYLSASGVMATSHKQDVVANNLANAETVGFKRDIPLFRQRLSEAEQRQAFTNPRAFSDPRLANIGGGLLISPTAPDASQGDIEHTASPLDVAIQGEGFFAVRPAGNAAVNADGDSTLLTRNGQFMVDRQGYLVLSNEQAQRVLDVNRQPIQLSPDGGQVVISRDGGITQGSTPVGQIGVFNVADPSKLQKQGGTLLKYADAGGLRKSDAMLQAEFIERSNVDPTTELTELIKTQRLLEANANMIRYQDQTLAKLVNEVGKIS